MPERATLRSDFMILTYASTSFALCRRCRAYIDDMSRNYFTVINATVTIAAPFGYDFELHAVGGRWTTKPGCILTRSPTPMRPKGTAYERTQRTSGRLPSWARCPPPPAP